MMDIGRICLKTAGREAGSYCIIIKKIDDKFVMITGPRAATNVRRRKCNIAHLEPLPEKLKIKENADDSEILTVFDKEKLFEKLKIIKPSAERIKQIESMKAEKQKKKEEREKKEAEKKAKEKKAKEEKKKEPKKEEKKPEPKKEESKKEKPKEEPKKEEKPKTEKKPKEKK